MRHVIFRRVFIKRYLLHRGGAESEARELEELRETGSIFRMKRENWRRFRFSAKWEINESMRAMRDWMLIALNCICMYSLSIVESRPNWIRLMNDF